MTRVFCCLASHASDTHTVQKEHLFFKLFQNARTINASVIFSYLLSFWAQYIHGSGSRGRMKERGCILDLCGVFFWGWCFCLYVCLFVVCLFCFVLSSCPVKLINLSRASWAHFRFFGGTSFHKTNERTN